MSSLTQCSLTHKSVKNPQFPALTSDSERIDLEGFSNWERREQGTRNRK